MAVISFEPLLICGNIILRRKSVIIIMKLKAMLLTHCVTTGKSQICLDFSFLSYKMPKKKHKKKTQTKQNQKALNHCK